MSGPELKYFYMGLPPASIFEKIARVDPEAPASIIDFAERIQEGRHLAEIQEQEEAHRACRKQWPSAILQGLQNIFNALFDDTRPRPAPRLSDAQAVQTDFTNVGNDIRQSIRCYFETHPRVYAQVRLTGAEEIALRPVPVSTILKAERAFTK
jgi:hypothetical protein